MAKLQNTDNDTLRVSLLNDIAIAFSDTNIDRSVYYARQALNLANQINYKEGIALSNMNLADIFKDAGNYQPAKNYYLISIKLYNELQSWSSLAEVYNKFAKVYELQGNDRQAMIYYNQAVQNAERSGHMKAKGYALNYIGGIHHREGNYEQSYEYFLQSLMIREEIKDSLGMAASYNNVGEIFNLRGEYEKALDYYNKSIAINKAIDNMVWLAINYENLGSVYLNQDMLSKALENYKLSLQINDSINNIQGIVTSMNSLGAYYRKIGDYNTSLTYYQRAFDSSIKYHVVSEKSRAALGLSDTYRYLNMFRSSLEYYKIHTQIDDSIFNIQKHKQIVELEAQYEAERSEQQLILKEQENKLLERNVKIVRLRYIIILGGLNLFLIISVLMYGRQRNKIKKDRELLQKNKEIHEAQHKLMEAELKAKNNDLMNFALHIVQKNDFLQTVKNDLKDIKCRFDEEKPPKLNELLLKVNQNLRKSTELKEFQENVDNVNQEFFKKLIDRFPDLTENEKRLSALLRLNLSSKEIATLNNISIKAVEMGRYRLRKKINLETNEVLTEFLQNL